MQLQSIAIIDDALKHPEHTQRFVADLAAVLLPKCGVYRSRLENLFRDGRIKELCTEELDYTCGASASHVVAARQFLALFSKNESLDLGVDKEFAAFVKFQQAERACVTTNDLFHAWGRGLVSFRPRDVRILYAARRQIQRVLGRAPNLSELSLRFGPGSTTGIRKQHANPQNKFAEGIVCSERLVHSGLLTQALRELPHWADAFSVKHYVDSEGYEAQSVLVKVSAGTLQFVPKTALTYRSIGVEPNLNLMLQLGIGQRIASRLKLHGIDIHDQSRNQSAARVGSLTGELATLDLSSASDTISYELVKFLLPEDWFFILDSVRTDRYYYKGQTLCFAKFSAMGNGFTFPLETLIFWALSRASCADPSKVLAYGDDIVVPSVDALTVGETLTLCGFSLNRAKSFWAGPFRESCGADYYFGIPVRPCYMRENISIETLYVMHNFFYRNAEWELCNVCLGWIPKHARLHGPDGYGDGHLLGAFIPRVQKATQRKGFAGVTFDTLTFSRRTKISVYPGDHVSPLYSIYIRPDTHVHLGHEPLPATQFSRCGRPLWPVPGKGEVRRTDRKSVV